jgi:uncharacterized circularly permuted ATP-grasp superfamily protein
LPDGSFVVLEDNLRVPSGVSYMLANRQISKSCCRRCSATTRASDRALRAGLLATLRELAPEQRPIRRSWC